MLTRRALARIAAVLLASITTLHTARADVIDGRWCSQDGRHLEIDGEIVVTPGGERLKGSYDRHHFVFTLPALETHGGERVDVVLVWSDVVHIRYSAGLDETTESEPEVWTRCKERLSTRTPGVRAWSTCPLGL